MYRYEFTREAYKQLHKLPVEVQRLMIKKLDYVVSSDRPLSFAKSLIHYSAGQYRLRVGDYRIIFDTDESLFIILAVGHRRDIYRP